MDLRLFQQNRPEASISAPQRYVCNWGRSGSRADTVNVLRFDPISDGESGLQQLRVIFDLCARVCHRFDIRTQGENPGALAAHVGDRLRGRGAIVASTATIVCA